jgi:hypothetical protein
VSGVLIVGELFRGDTPLTEEVPAAQIKAWKLPQGSPPRSIVVTRVSRTERVMLDGSSLKTVTERVQATVRAESGLAREAILGRARTAAGGKVGTIAGFGNVAVTNAGTGPDFEDDAASIFMGSIDFHVSFNEPA